MQQRTQTFEEIIESLSPVEAAWMDAHAQLVMATLASWPIKPAYGRTDLVELLEKEFDVGMTVVRLFLGLPKDEFTGKLRAQLHGAGTGVTAFKKKRTQFLDAMESLGVTAAIADAVHRPTTWADVLVERLRSGRGSAIKGQKRGRALEDFAEAIVARVFGEKGYHVRTSFVGESGVSEAKADFAIPTKENPRILIESKAYGATGSKQTDVLGDVRTIIAEKRHDTVFLLVTDGVTWKDRANDMRKLIDLQNRGRIARIYTVKMAEDLEHDLQQLKAEQGL